MKKLAFILFLTLIGSSLASAAPPKVPNFLPPSFNGWQISDASTTTDPAGADPADAAVLKEYGFSLVELANYTRNDRKMQVKAARFENKSGAYGAFTYYQQPQMQAEKIGDEGASNNTRILFYRGNFLVDVTLDRLTAMSAADLRALAASLPTIQGSDSVPPSLPGDLPQKLYIPHTVRYVMGPVASERLGVPVPPALVGFDQSAELVEAKYRSTWGEANLVLISYPTPQIAAQKLHSIESAALPGGPFYFKRTGPIVVVVNGNIPSDEAQTLLAYVNYDAEVTMNQATKLNPKDNIGNLIVGVFVLTGFIALLALILGFAFGGIRVLAKKIFPDKVFDRPEDVEIIRLNLK